MLQCGCHLDVRMFCNGHCPTGALYNSQDNSQVRYQYQDLTYSPVDAGRNGTPAMLQNPNIGNNNQLPYLDPGTMFSPGDTSQNGTQGGNLYDGMVPRNEEAMRILCDNLNASGHNAPAASPGPLTNYPTQSYPPQRGVSGQYTCEKCSAAFTLERDLERHRNVVHRKKNDPIYRCRCGKVGGRKDNHRRHLKKCKADQGFLYTCKCNIAHVEKKEHLDHIKTCGPRY